MKQMISVQIGSLFVTALVAASADAAEWTVGVEFTTIRATVDAAASGDTIHIPARVYDEQIVIVDKNLTLVGQPGAVIHATTTMTRTLLPYYPGVNTYPLVAIVRSEAVFTGLTFEGERLGNRPGYQNSFYGIVFRSSGGRLENCTVRGFRGSTTAESRGINVVNFVGDGAPAINVDILNSIFADNERSIVLSGSVTNPTLLRTTFTIDGNTFTGLGPGAQIPQNGILILLGAGGAVKANTMAGYSYAGGVTGFSAPISAGQFVSGTYRPLQPIRFERNTFSDSDHHMLIMAANNSQVISNTFTGTAPGWRRWGALALSGTNVLVADNEFSDLPIGIELFGGEANGTIIRGVAAGTKLFTNRFCRVHEPVRAQPLATGTQETGTEIICPVPPPRDLHVPADYATIQQAIDAAASGDTIHIAPGDYFEQIVIANKNSLTLLGQTGAVLRATDGMTETLQPFGWGLIPLFGIFRSDVVLRNLTFDGHNLGALYKVPSSFGNYENVLIGIHSLGSNGRFENCTLRGFRGETLTAAAGANALYTDNSVIIGSAAVRTDIFNSIFSDNELSIHLRGDPVRNPTLLRTSFTVEGNTVSGLGAVPLAVDGIAIRNGATGDVRNNTIRDHTYTGTGDSFSSGISALDGRANVRSNYVPLLTVKYKGNTFSNNDEHLVLIAANGSEIVNNVFHGRGPDQPRWGALAISGTNVLVANNDFSDLDTAILLFANDHFFTGWPAIPTAMNIDLSANWFCNVAEPLRVQSFITVFQERARQLCPFRPVFQSITKPAALTVRSWHGQPLVLEVSTNLQHWAPIHTNSTTLPTCEYQDVAAGLPHRFYRAAAP